MNVNTAVWLGVAVAVGLVGVMGRKAYDRKSPAPMLPRLRNQHKYGIIVLRATVT